MPDIGSTGPISASRDALPRDGVERSAAASATAIAAGGTRLADDRLERIESIRRGIADGSYLSEDRLREAICRAIDDLRR